MITGVTADSRKVKPGCAVRRPAGRQGRRPRLRARRARRRRRRGAAPRGRSTACRAGGRRSPTPRRAYALAAAAFWGAQPADLRRRHRHQRQDLGRHLLPPDLRAARPQPRPAWARWACAPATSRSPRPGLTTPDAGDVAALLADLAGRGVTHLALEASSHGIDQRRLDGVHADRRRLPQPDPGPPRLPRHHGGLPRRQAAAVRGRCCRAARTAVLNADSDAYPGLRRRGGAEPA